MTAGSSSPSPLPVLVLVVVDHLKPRPLLVEPLPPGHTGLPRQRLARLLREEQEGQLRQEEQNGQEGQAEQPLARQLQVQVQRHLQLGPRVPWPSHGQLAQLGQLGATAQLGCKNERLLRLPLAQLLEHFWLLAKPLWRLLPKLHHPHRVL